MKRILITTMAVLAFSTGYSQTNTNVPLPDLTAPTGNFLQDFKNFFTDTKPYLTNSVMGGIGGLYVDKKWGGMIDVEVPITQQVSFGFAGAYIGRELYDATFAVNVGKTWNLPLIGEVYQWGETGPGWNFTKKEAVAHMFTGISKGWQLGSHWSIKITGMVGSISDLNGPASGGVGSIGYKF